MPRLNALENKIECHLEDEEVQEVLRTGTDLRQYSKQIEKQLKDAENKSIQDYIKESQNIVSLHKQIAACDDILERMESMLLNFQSDLGSISNEIVYLQKKSIKMSQMLHNRQAVRGQLSQFIEDISLPKSLIDGINRMPTSDKEFCTLLGVLDRKMKLVKEEESGAVRCCVEGRTTQEDLKTKAVSKIRAHLLEQVSKFRKPMSNYQVIQNALLKYKFFYEFAAEHEPTVAQEVKAEYVDTMSKIYFSYFKYYSSELVKLMYEEKAGKEDLMGVEEAGRGGLLVHRSSLKQKGTVFTLGTRDRVLGPLLEAPIIIPHSAIKSENRLPYEALFRSEQYALVDNACREFLFICEFFRVHDHRAMELFTHIMDKTLALLVNNLERYVSTCYDSIALLLCIQLVLRYQLLCHKRAVPALDRYWETLLQLLWPRFKYVFQQHILSVKECDPTKLSKDMKPYCSYITRRYAEFAGAVVSMCEDFPDEEVSRLLARLHEAVQLFLLRMAANFPQRKHQLVFLINNYDTALTILLERTRENCKEVESFREQLQGCSAEYVEEVLSPHFGGMIQFVKEAEPLLERGRHDQLDALSGKAMMLVDEFCKGWKEGLRSVDAEVPRSFPSLVMGSQLCQAALAQLLVYYERFHKLLSPQARPALVNIHNLKVEIKKYKRTSF